MVSSVRFLQSLFANSNINFDVKFSAREGQRPDSFIRIDVKGHHGGKVLPRIALYYSQVANPLG